MSRPASPAMVEVGRRLRAARNTRGWSMEAASCHSGFATSVIGSYERANRTPTVPALLHLADVYGVPAASFLPDVPLVDPLETEMMVEEMRGLVGRLEAALALYREAVTAAVGGAA